MSLPEFHVLTEKEQQSFLNRFNFLSRPNFLSSLILFSQPNYDVYALFNGSIIQINAPKKIGIPILKYLPQNDKIVFYPGSLYFLSPFFKNKIISNSIQFAYGSHLSKSQIRKAFLPSSSSYSIIYYKQRILGIGKIIKKKNVVIRVINEMHMYSIIKQESLNVSIKDFPLP